MRRRGAAQPQPPAPLPSKLAGNDGGVPVAPAPLPAGATKPYTVKQDDYLTKIAREQLGDLNRFQEIVALNLDNYPSLKTNPDLIHPGWVLKLPAGGDKPSTSEIQPPAP
jgi:nucleoid-associated protein YgaU